MYKKATESDFSFIYAMYMNEVINPHLLYEQMSEEQFKPIYAKLLDDDILYIFIHNNENAGMFKLIPHTYRSAHIVYLGSFAIHPNFIGQGLGLIMLNEIINHAKENNFKRIELSAGVQNEKAIALYKKAGFVEEGILKKYTYFKSENRYIDEVMMSYIMD
jgi:L-phenylalanine/L-methionine N-acetyltransferase